MMEAEALDQREALLLDPNTMYGDKFESVMLDMLAGNHISQASSHNLNLTQGPTDNGEDEENPTEDY